MFENKDIIIFILGLLLVGLVVAFFLMKKKSCPVCDDEFPGSKGKWTQAFVQKMSSKLQGMFPNATEQQKECINYGIVMTFINKYEPDEFLKALKDFPDAILSQIRKACFQAAPAPPMPSAYL